MTQFFLFLIEHRGGRGSDYSWLALPNRSFSTSRDSVL